MSVDRKSPDSPVVALRNAPLYVKLLTLGPLLGTLGSTVAMVLLPEPQNLKVFAGGMLLSGAGVAGFLVVSIRWSREHYRRLAGGLCPACGYDLRSSMGRCPECGRFIGANEGSGIDRSNRQL